MSNWFTRWLGLDGFEARDNGGTPGWQPPTAPPRRASERGVSTGEAFSLSLVYRAISIHSVSAKQLGLKVFKGEDEQEAPSFIRRPDVNTPRSVFIEQTVVGLASTGNAYWRVTRDNQDRVQNVVNLNPLDVRPETNLAGDVVGYQYRGNTIPPKQIQHLALLRVPGRVEGLGPIQAAQTELRGALDVRDYSNHWFRDSGVPSGVLKSDQVLSHDQAQGAKEQWNKTAGAREGVAVLGGGLSYEPIFLSPEDAQFIQSQQFNVAQVARLFGVPASLMLASQEGQSQTYQNVEQDWLGYTRFSLMQYLIEIEDALTQLLPGSREARFNVEALLRADTLTRYEAHKIGIEAGFLTVDEVRRIEKLES